MKKYRGFAYLAGFKIALMAAFSSCYQNDLFIPFVRHFTENLDNPWNYFYSMNGGGDQFPYHPLMLYILSVFYVPAKLLSGDSVVLTNALFKLPTLLADILIAWLLIKLLPRKRREVLIFYFASPIVLYSCYMHSQLDLIPTALLFLSVYLLTRGRWGLAAVSMGLAVCTKLHVAAALPLMLIYMLRDGRRKEALASLAIIASIYLAFSFPYILSDGYVNMVLSNRKQSLLFDTYYGVGRLNLYLPIFAALVIYTRFAFYNKINNDLFYTYIGMLFSVFISLVVPSPGWYVWPLPFLSIFYIKLYSESSAKVLAMYAALSLACISYFVFFYLPDHCDLVFMTTPVSLKLGGSTARSVSFTVLDTVLLGTVYALYRFGVRSNSVYRRAYATIIGIGGDSGAGKSVLLSDIKAMLGAKVLDLEGDAEHRWQRFDENWKRHTHLDPKANYLHRQATHLLTLKSGRAVQRVDYDHATGKFTPPKKVSPKEFVIISGLHTFYLPLMRKLVDFKIYMDTDDRLRKHWKVLRDTAERGYTKEAIMGQMEDRSADAEKYVRPQREFADMTVRYFVDRDFEIGNKDAPPEVLLKVSASASIQLENLLGRLVAAGVDVYWDYADDLKSQYLLLGSPPGAKVVEEVAGEVVFNIEELVPEKFAWAEGYRGFVQLMVLIALSEQLREADVSHEI